MKIISLCAPILITLLTLSDLVIGLVPIIEYVFPYSGEAIGGNAVTILGSNFTDVKAVKFNDACACFTVDSDSKITAIVPPGTAGAAHIAIMTTDVQSSPTQKDLYTYVGDCHAYTTTFNGKFIRIKASNDVADFANNIELCAFPDILAITPDGRNAYVCENTTMGDHYLRVIDLATLTIDSTSPIQGILEPIAMSIPPNSKKGYVIDRGTNEVKIIDLETKALITPAIPTGTNGSAIAINPDGTKAYVCNKNSIGTVTIIDLITNKLDSASPINVGDSPCSMAITPDGKKAYVCNQLSDNVSIINLITNTLISTLTVGKQPTGVAISPDGQKAYVSYFLENFISAIDIATDTINPETLIKGIERPDSIAISSDGRSIFVTASREGVYYINVNTNPATVTLIPFPEGYIAKTIVISPEQAPIASFTITPQSNECFATFDASASTSPLGTIMSYIWDFGDGNIETTTTPITTHEYTIGSYTATLTVINSAGTSTQQIFTGQTVCVNGGSNATRSVSFDVPFVTLPVIAELNKNFGPEEGKAVTIIKGHFFKGATAVQFGDKTAKFIVGSDNYIFAYPPPGSGTIFVTVTTPVGTSQIGSKTLFTYQVGMPSEEDLIFDEPLSLPPEKDSEQIPIKNEEQPNSPAPIDVKEHSKNDNVSTPIIENSDSAKKDTESKKSKTKKEKKLKHKKGKKKKNNSKKTKTTEKKIHKTVSKTPRKGKKQAVSYKIYRDSNLKNLVEVISAKKQALIFSDPKGSRINPKYYVVTVDKAGKHSKARKVIAKPVKINKFQLSRSNKLTESNQRLNECEGTDFEFKVSSMED